jgi:hypothetical protein
MICRIPQDHQSPEGRHVFVVMGVQRGQPGFQLIWYLHNLLRLNHLLFCFQSLDQLAFRVSLTPDKGTSAWATLNCSGGSPASRTTRAHSPALGRTRDYSDWDVCHKSRTRNPPAGWTAGRHGQESNLRPSDLRSDALPLRYHLTSRRTQM